MPGQPRILVLDSGPAIALDRLGYVDSLGRQDDITLAITPAVANELRQKPGEPGSGVPGRVVTVTPPARALAAVTNDPRRPAALHAGELETIAAVEHLGQSSGSIPVMAAIDDRAARRFAQSRGLTPPAHLTGALGLLRLVHLRGLNTRSLDEDVNSLRDAGYRLGDHMASRFTSQVSKEVEARRLEQRQPEPAPSPEPPSLRRPDPGREL